MKSEEKWEESYSVGCSREMFISLSEVVCNLGWQTGRGQLFVKPRNRSCVCISITLIKLPFPTLVLSSELEATLSRSNPCSDEL